MTRRGIATRISMVALLASSVAIGILGVGVWVMGGQAFTSLMVQAGDSADHAHAMFDQSVTGVLVVALVLAMVASVTLSVILARRLARPLEHIGDAAERVAAGDYRARVPAEGPTE
ncbi:MAG: HAMP domain-containing protein, partial [Candidatus Limnocylindrales bacterium]